MPNPRGMSSTQSRRGSARTRPDGASRDPSRPTLLAGGALLIVSAFYLVRYPIVHRDVLVQIEQTLLIGYSGIRAAQCLHAKRPRYGAMIFWLFVYTIFGLIQTVQLSKNDNPFHVPASDADLRTQLFVILLGCLAFDVANSRAWSSARPLTRGRALSLPRVTAAGWVAVVVSPLLVQRLGGVGALFSGRTAFADLAAGGGTYGTAQTLPQNIANVLPFVCLLALLWLRRGGAFYFLSRPDLSVLGALLGVLVVLFSNPISQPRYWVATVAIAVALVGRWRRRARFQLAFLGGFIVVSLVIFPYLDLFRYGDPGQVSIQIQSVTGIYVNKTDYGSSQDVVTAIAYVRDHGFGLGHQLISSLLFFVPRSIWSGKAEPTAQLIAQQINFGNLNLDAPLWAEGYVDFGIVGTVAVLAIFGFFVAVADRCLTGERPWNHVGAVIAPVFVGYELIILRGALLQAMGRLALFLVLGALISRAPVRSKTAVFTRGGVARTR